MKICGSQNLFVVESIFVTYYISFFSVGKASLDHMNMNWYQCLLGSVCSEFQ